MKKFLFVVLVTFIGLTSFAADNSVKPITPGFKTSPAVKETKVFKVPEGATVKPVKNAKGDIDCLLILFEDGSGLLICWW